MNGLTRKNWRQDYLGGHYKITISELFGIILENYFCPTLGDYRREIIVTSIRDNYGMISTIVFSINGSPPKGRAILISRGFHFDEYETKQLGDLFLFGRKIRASGPYRVEIDFSNKDGVDVVSYFTPQKNGGT